MAELRPDRESQLPEWTPVWASPDQEGSVRRAARGPAVVRGMSRVGRRRVGQCATFSVTTVAHIYVCPHTIRLGQVLAC